MQTYMDRIIDQTTVMVERIRSHDRSTLYEDEPSLGACPSCSGNIMENTLAYQCVHNEGRDKGCSFVFWKDTSGRWFDRTTATRLIEHGSLENLHGFFSQAGEGYETSVELKSDGKVMAKGSGQSEATENDEVLCPCPVCASRLDSCHNDRIQLRLCGLHLPWYAEHHVQATHYSRRSESIFENGKSALLEDFTSKRNRPFSAFLVLDKNRVAFDFPPRQAAADAKRFPVVPGTVAVCAAHKVNIIETETHYTAEENSDGCKIHIERTISKRDITREEAKELIETRKLGPFDDFTSKKKQEPVRSQPHLRKNESVAYKFAKR